MECKQSINLDTNKRGFGSIEVKQYDSARYIEATIYNNGTIYDLTGLTARVYGVKADDNSIFNDCTITDAINGIIRLDLTNQMLASEGELDLEIRLYNATISLSTMPFTIFIRKSLYNENAVKSSNEFTVLDNLIKDAGDMSNVKNKVFARQFKPKFIQTIWCMNTVDGDGRRTIPISTTTLKGWIDTYKSAGVEGIEIPIHVNYNSSTNDLYYETNLDTIDYIITYCASINMPVFLMKFHESYAISAIFSMGESVFKSRFKAMITEVSARYQNKGIQYMGLFNEWQHFYKKNGFVYNSVTYDYTGFVIECLAIPRTYGFLTSVSCAGCSPSGWSSWITVDDSVKSACDIFMVNGYPPVSNRAEKTTKDDCINAWNVYGIHNVIREVSTKWNGKPIIQTETGIMKWWYNFYSPGDSTLQYGTDSLGKTTEYYLYGLLESLKKYDSSTLLAVCWWYTDNLLDNTTKVKSILNDYLGGVV